MSQQAGDVDTNLYGMAQELYGLACDARSNLENGRRLDSAENVAEFLRILERISKALVYLEPLTLQRMQESMRKIGRLSDSVNHTVKTDPKRVQVAAKAK